MPQFRVFVPLLIVSSLFAGVDCWWLNGHALVAAIAKMETSPEVQALIDNILSNDPVFESWQASAAWSDSLKDTGALTTFNNWHYYDQPLVIGNVSAAVVSLPPAGNNVLWAGMQVQNALGRTKMGWVSSFAMRMLFHFVGDIHQPLHAVNLFSPPHFTTSAGDLGGNLFKVVFYIPSSNSTMTNLHSLWDSCAGLYADFITIPLSDSFLNQTNQIAKQLINDIDISSYSLATNWTAWADESYNIAVNHVYSGISYQETLSESSSYIKQARNVCQTRIRLAGARLAYLLNSTNLAGASDAETALQQLLFQRYQQQIGGGGGGGNKNCSSSGDDVDSEYVKMTAGQVVLIGIVSALAGALVVVFTIRFISKRNRGSRNSNPALDLLFGASELTPTRTEGHYENN